MEWTKAQSHQNQQVHDRLVNILTVFVPSLAFHWRQNFQSARLWTSCRPTLFGALFLRPFYLKGTNIFTEQKTKSHKELFICDKRQNNDSQVFYITWDFMNGGKTRVYPNIIFLLNPGCKNGECCPLRNNADRIFWEFAGNTSLVLTLVQSLVKSGIKICFDHNNIVVVYRSFVKWPPS